MPKRRLRLRRGWKKTKQQSKVTHPQERVYLLSDLRPLHVCSPPSPPRGARGNSFAPLMEEDPLACQPSLGWISGFQSLHYRVLIAAKRSFLPSMEVESFPEGRRPRSSQHTNLEQLLHFKRFVTIFRSFASSATFLLHFARTRARLRCGLSRIRLKFRSPPPSEWAWLP